MYIYIIYISFLFLLMGISQFNNFISNSNYTCKTKRFTTTLYTAIIVTVLLSIFRYNVGWDYMGYYETIVDNKITNILLNREYLTMLLIIISRLLNAPFIYFAINGLICIILIMLTVKKYSSDYWVSIIFFITFPLFFLNSLSVVRNFTAIAIIFYGFRLIENKKFFKYLILVIIASLFHKTAIIAIIFYFIKDMKFKRDVYVAALIITPLLSNILTVVILNFFPNYAVYTNVATTQQGTKAIIVIVFIAIVTIIFIDRLKLNSPVFFSYFNIFFIGVCIYLTFYRQGTLGHRLSLYGTIFSLIIIPDILKLFTKKWDGIFIKTLFYLMCIAMFFYTIYVGRATYIPYKLFFLN